MVRGTLRAAEEARRRQQATKFNEPRGVLVRPGEKCEQGCLLQRRRDWQRLCVLCRVAGRALAAGGRDELRARSDKKAFLYSPTCSEIAADGALTSSVVSEGLAASNPYRVAAKSAMIRGRSTASSNRGASNPAPVCVGRADGSAIQKPNLSVQAPQMDSTWRSAPRVSFSSSDA
jgi:hypothetical protein